ncbi:tyrosine-type recombinase/integrase [Saccharolobus caldissimus]|uniref:Integrase n=1 Tax=Saccharolobus caldissimus TaxID=1702097 RepID=A0AAQ4CMH1_9CREN|nr:site-specific integrase [Saccharolobus caldissimus]BDB97002.1 integrase [Saccharolobus caldissimus]
MDVKIDEIDQDTRRKILQKVLEKNVSYDKLGISRTMVWYYKTGKYDIPSNVVEKLLKFLTPEEMSEIIYGISPDSATINDAIKVVIKAMRDPQYREFLLLLLQKHLGEFIKELSTEYLVTKDDIELFEKINKPKAKKTYEDYIRYLKDVLRDMNYIITLDKIKEYLAETEEISKHRARHIGIVLKLFIREVVSTKNPSLANLLYHSFRIPRPGERPKEVRITIEDIKKVLSSIEDIGAKAFFLVMAETGLRTGEVLNLKIDQVDLEKREINLSKSTQTKRSYITFLHKKTVKWLKEDYLPFRQGFIRKYEHGVIQLGGDVKDWEQKFFPFQEERIRADIKEAMTKAGIVFRLYDLRAHFAMYMTKQGVSPMIIDILQGRVSPGQFRILQKHYLPFGKEELKEIYDRYAPKILE